MPPALILIAQLFMGALTGAWGLVLALPVIIIIIVLALYQKQNQTIKEINCCRILHHSQHFCDIYSIVKTPLAAG